MNPHQNNKATAKMKMIFANQTNNSYKNDILNQGIKPSKFIIKQISGTNNSSTIATCSGLNSTSRNFYLNS